MELYLQLRENSLFRCPLELYSYRIEILSEEKKKKKKKKKKKEKGKAKARITHPPKGTKYAMSLLQQANLLI
jgi:hypothetical protein